MYNKRIENFDTAMTFYRQRKYGEAERILLKMLENNRRDKYALFQMGKIRLQFRDRIGAEEYFKNV